MCVVFQLLSKLKTKVINAIFQSAYEGMYLGDQFEYMPSFVAAFEWYLFHVAWGGGGKQKCATKKPSCTQCDQTVRVQRLHYTKQ